MGSAVVVNEADMVSELRFDRVKNGQTITITLRLEGESVTLIVGPDANADGPTARMTCTMDQWHAIRFAAEWYFHALDELESI